MTKDQLKSFKKLLEAKLAELSAVVRNREGITIEKSPDALDEVQNMSERELAIRTLDRESKLLNLVRLALQRMEDGTYGTCLNCEEEISLKRLNAVPQTPFCIACQELADRQKDEGSEESLEEMLVGSAA
jgi:DnaK suppressor protein